MTDHTSEPVGSHREPFAISPRGRKWTLVVHIVASVGLLGDTSAILLLAVVASTTSDTHLAAASFRFMRLLIPMFGIPLTLTALVTGLGLAFGTSWGGLRRFWVRAKLALVLVVLAIGALVLAPVAFPSGHSVVAVRVIVGAAVDVLALLTAVSFAVFKPAARWRRQRIRNRTRT